ncbi:MAG TPA: ABC transporter permease [Burkholderiales bacterium]|jgi:peptide/nickel transport system permease protein|nr:ABC transporter permease [Burkholderiales bacterium]
MIPYLTRRAMHSAFALLGLIIAVFFLARLTGDPTDLFLPVDASREDRIEFARKHGYDRPATEQFVHFVGDVMEGNLGFSLRKQRPAVEVVLEAYPTTLKLAGVTLLIGISLAIVVGALAAYRTGGWFDRMGSTLALVGASAPDFWVAITAILFFSVSLHWLPTSGTGGILFWIMPVTVLALRPFGLLVQVVRGAMLDALASAYVKTARAKGVSESAVIFVHALRNACLAVVTVAGNLAVGLINGAVIVETVFGWPGVGKLMIDAVIQRDFAVVQASIMVTAIAIFLMNVLIDLLYAALDPRIRHQ